jgi:rfaE bifunctional protein nucleotidyltransferase chain/domain
LCSVTRDHPTKVELTVRKCYPSTVHPKVQSTGALKQRLLTEKKKGKKIVLTNGCFDLLHVGHLHLLRQAKNLGDVLVVAVNSDSSVRQLKGSGRPIVVLEERVEILAALETVDYVTQFDDADPYRVIQQLQPDVLVKGGDWQKENVIGGDLVEQNGGTVEVIPYLEGYSTSKIVERIRNEKYGT